MTLAAIAMVRDEEDVLPTVLEHLIGEGVDRFVIADNRSQDNTREILHAFGAVYPDRFTIIHDPEPGYYQREKMSKLAEVAGEQGATWVLPFDADEVWYSLAGGTIAEALDELPEVSVIAAQGWDHVATNLCGSFSPWRRDHQQPLPKVAFRWTPGAMLHMGNHDVDHVGGQRAWNVLAYRHFGYRSFEQMRRKVRQGKEAYDAAPDIHEMHGSHWRTLGAMNDRELRREWDALCGSDGLVYDPVPFRSSSRASTVPTSPRAA